VFASLPLLNLQGAEPAPSLSVDIDALRHIPVFHKGRIQPFDTFANIIMAEVCDRPKKRNVKLGLKPYLDEKQLADKKYAAASELFPGGEDRRWDGAELVFSWLVEQEKWEDVPFIYAPHPDLRKVLGVPVQHMKFKYVSPRQVLESEGLREKLAEIAARQAQSREEETISTSPATATADSHSDEQLLSLSKARRTATAGGLLLLVALIAGLMHLGRRRAAASEPSVSWPLRVSLGTLLTGTLLVALASFGNSEIPWKTVVGLQPIKSPEAEAINLAFEPTPLDEHIQKLIDRYQVYRTISFDARKPLTLGQFKTVGSREDFLRKASLVVRLLQETSTEGRDFQNMLQIFADGPGEGEMKLVCQATLQSVQAVIQIADVLNRSRQAIQMGPVETDLPVAGTPLARAAEVTEQFVRSTEQLDSHFQNQKLDLAKQFGEMSTQQQEGLSKIFREMISKSKELKRLARETQLALYYSSHQNQSKGFKSFQSPMVMPALDTAALDKARDVRNSSQPWLSLQALLYGNSVMKSYPQPEVNNIRKAWKTTADHYRNRTSKSRTKDFATAQEKLASSLRSLGKSLEKQRLELVNKELEPHHRDDDLISYTQYPIAGKDLQRLDIEVSYNRINPFKRSFVLCLLALAMFSVAFGKMRKNIFALAIVVCLATLLWTAYGFYLRIMITGWAPVTNMYETVIWVPFATLTLATWFLLWPITQTGIRNAWRLTAIPGSWEAKPLDESQEKQLTPANWKLAGFASGLLRLGIMSGMFYFLTMMPLGDGGRPYFNILPDLSASQGHGAGVANTLGVWIVGLFCVLVGIWMLPRLILSIPISFALIPLSWRQNEDFGQQMEEVYERKPFALAGTALASVCFLLACLAPNDALDENISALQPVLRTNFWLTIHVLCIVSSYAAGALAMGLGNLALFHYLFGKYRTVSKTDQPNADDASTDTDASPPPAARKRPPEACVSLASYAYKAIQVAVLLLAAGTILGGLWADVSWGRFWGWDPKEVWALISLLVYLAILHGRMAGWFSNFGLIFGTVLGATMIVMSWYGVNFVLPMLSTNGEVGLHSYGSGAGGLEYVAGFVIANWLFLAAATTRYTISTSGT
jgi:ABC-type transport system involved in cytochrome c biogenesis permease subunit